MITFSDLGKYTFLGDTAVTLKDIGFYTQNGGTSTWTLPSLGSSAFFRTPKVFFCKNMGSGIVTITSSGGELFHINGFAAGSTYILNPFQGAIIYDDGTYWKALNEINQTFTGFVGTVFTQTTVQSVSSTGATTMFGGGIGTLTLPSNFWNVGKTLDISLAGIYSTIATPGNLSLSFYLGNTAIATKVISNLLPAASNNAFEIAAKVTCITNGTSGSTMINGKMSYDASGSTQSSVTFNNGFAAIAYDTTASAQTLSVKATWATTGNTISTTTATVRALN